MEAGILTEHTAQKKMVIIQTKPDWRRRGSDERGGSPPQWLAHRQSDRGYPEWRWSSKEEITQEGKKKVFRHPVKDTKILNANLLQNFWMQPCSTLKKKVWGSLTVKVSIFAKTSLFRFSHASISKIIKCLLVDIGEKLHTLIKKCKIPWNCSLDYQNKCHDCVVTFMRSHGQKPGFCEYWELKGVVRVLFQLPGLILLEGQF